MMSGATCGGGGGGGYQKVNGAAANIMEDERRCDAEKVADDVMLPGFRFHPTDEELVGFYLKKKIQQKPLAIELIKQLDIYKYDPWDLPKLATTGEKEWYFYCPRDRKYRNSARPNRVTSAGFWKATGTDRPIYSSEGPKCIGLKKSLVFYKGRAAKGIKTDWMMHEFRLPSTADSNKNSIKPPLDKKIPPNDSWAICRIFKKTSSMAQRALAHSWAARLPEPTNSGVYYGGEIVSQPPTGSEGRTVATSHLNVISSTELPPTASFCFSPTASCNSDMASILMGIPPSLVCGDQAGGKTHSSIDFGQQESCDHTLHAVVHGEEMTCMKKNMIGDPEADLGAWQEGGFPFNFVAPTLLEAWKSNVQWESMPCSSSDVSGSCNFSKCHT